jgi:hypothetical protein
MCSGGPPENAQEDCPITRHHPHGYSSGVTRFIPYIETNISVFIPFELQFLFCGAKERMLSIPTIASYNGDPIILWSHVSVYVLEHIEGPFIMAFSIQKGLESPRFRSHYLQSYNCNTFAEAGSPLVDLCLTIDSEC